MSGYAAPVRFIIERDAALAELAALRGRIEALCDESDAQEYAFMRGVIGVADLRAALAAEATS